MINLFFSHNIDKNKWNDFVFKSINGTIFNTIEWINVWEDSFPNAKAVFLIDNNWECGIVFMKIKKIIFNNYYSLPFGDYGGILISPKLKVESEKSREIIKYFPQSYGMIGITDFYSAIKNMPQFNKILCRTHIIELEEPSNIFNSLSPEKKRIVKQIDKYDVQVDLLYNEEELDECYRMILATAQRHNTKPRFGINFYKNIFRFMGKYLRWCIAKKDNKPLANMINFVYKDTIFYWDGGSYDFGLKYRPNDAIIWDNIKWGNQNGYKYYNLGSSPNPGLAKFKESWNAKEKYYPFYYKKNLLFKLCQSILKK